MYFKHFFTMKTIAQKYFEKFNLDTLSEANITNFLDAIPYGEVELSIILESMTSLSYDLNHVLALDVLLKELELHIIKALYENLYKIPSNDLQEKELDEEFRELCKTLKNADCEIDTAYTFNGETATILQTIQNKGLKNALTDYKKIFGKSQKPAHSF